MPMIRIIDNGFQDGISQVPPGFVAESSRTDSVTSTTAKGFNDQRFPETSNEMATIGFQILTHEMMDSLKFRLGSEKFTGGLNCCNPRNDSRLQSLIDMNEFCMPINVKANDQCYGNNTKCLNYIKILKSLNNCKLDETALPINFHTPFIDCELIYNPVSQVHLDNNGGKFDTNNITALKQVFLGYDTRSKALPLLFRYLWFFASLHNIIFDELRRVQPNLNISTVALEARKFSCAVYQKIFIDMLATVLCKLMWSSCDGLKPC